MKNKKLLTCILGALIFATIPFAIKNNNFNFTKKFISAEVLFESESFLVKNNFEIFSSQFNSRPTNIGSANILIENMKTKNFLLYFNEYILDLAKNPFLLKEKIKKNNIIFSNELNNLIYRLNIENKNDLIRINFYTYNKNESELLLKLIIKESEEFVATQISSYLNGLIEVLQELKGLPLEKLKKDREGIHILSLRLKEKIQPLEGSKEEKKKIIDLLTSLEKNSLNISYYNSLEGQKLFDNKIIFIEKYLLKNKKQVKKINFYKKNIDHLDFITLTIISLFFGFLITLLFSNLFKKNKKIT